MTPGLRTGDDAAIEERRRLCAIYFTLTLAYLQKNC